MYSFDHYCEPHKGQKGPIKLDWTGLNVSDTGCELPLFTTHFSEMCSSEKYLNTT